MVVLTLFWQLFPRFPKAIVSYWKWTVAKCWVQSHIPRTPLEIAGLWLRPGLQRNIFFFVGKIAVLSISTNVIIWKCPQVIHFFFLQHNLVQEAVRAGSLGRCMRLWPDPSACLTVCPETPERAVDADCSMDVTACLALKPLCLDIIMNPGKHINVLEKLTVLSYRLILMRKYLCNPNKQLM